MPRSFLVKKHSSHAKKPNYGELETQKEVTTAPYCCEGIILPMILQPKDGPSLSHDHFWERNAIIARVSMPFTSDGQLKATTSANCPDLAFRLMDTFSTSAQSTPLRDTLNDLNVSSCICSKKRPLNDCSTFVVENDTQNKVSGTEGHNITEHLEKFECSDCHKMYHSFSGLAIHTQLQCSLQTKKYFSCKYCDKEYASLGALKMHIRTHTLPCVCKICGKAFSRPWLLQGHIRTHTGEKPFACSQCSRAFADRSNLRAHLQTHSDVKRYQCKACSKTFSRMSLLAKHEESACCSMT
ncbi:zinc finger protein SNAI3 [Protopterus annectens]|uniref:zinc finger protein SNAI3 n=1 Tax=Protopterus annectens TaxID=7888 RepID=UPI001CF9B632|nr:zinc finger protein SNAI3 [Protopterus annectens]